MARPALNKDTRLCISLAARPSNIGTRFHNYLYEQLGLDFIYKAFTTTDIAAAIGGVRALGIRGCSVSMPFKQDVLSLVDHVEESARAINAVNTIVNDDGVLTASNTDYIAVQRLIAEHGLDPRDGVLIRGSGGMASAVATAFRDNGFGDGVIVARNAEAPSEEAARRQRERDADERVPEAMKTDARDDPEVHPRAEPHDRRRERLLRERTRPRGPGISERDGHADTQEERGARREPHERDRSREGHDDRGYDAQRSSRRAHYPGRCTAVASVGRRIS